MIKGQCIMLTLSPDQLQQVDTALSKFHKLIRKRRVFKAIENESGINLEQQSQKNLLALYEGLRNGRDLPAEIREHIDKEKARKEDALTPDEFNFLNAALPIPMIGNHASFNADQILEKSNGYVYSSTELKRRKIEARTHTPEGAESDCVFLSYSYPEKINTVNFLAGADFFTVNLDEYAKKDPVGYASLWTDGHAYAYEQEQAVKPVYYQTDNAYTHVHGQYKSELNPLLTYSKALTFSYPNQTLPTVTRKESEISVGRHIKLYHILRLIEYLRYLDPVIRKTILTHSNDPKLLATLFDSLFTPGEKELHSPCAFQFKVHDDRNTYTLQQMQVDHYKNKKELYDAILNDDLMAFKKCYQQSNELFYRYDYQHYSNLSLLNLAVLLNRAKIITFLLKNGADAEHKYFNNNQSILSTCAMRTALQDAVERKDTDLIKLLCAPPKKKKSALSSTFTANVSEVVLFTAIADKADLNLFQYLFSFYHYDQTALNRLLILAIYYDHHDAVRFLLQKGANPNASLEIIFNADNTHLVPLSLNGTALTIAAHFGRRNALEALLQHGADPNTPIQTSGIYDQLGQGESALMEALDGFIESDYMEMDDGDSWPIDRKRYGQLKSEKTDYYQILHLLIDYGANPYYISRRQFYSDLESYINQHPEDQSLKQLYQRIPRVTNKIWHAPSELREYQHESYAVITGKDEDQDDVFLIGKINDSFADYQTIPGGPANYRIDKDLREALIKQVGYQVGINLYQEEEKSNPIILKDEESLIHIYHYELRQPVSFYNINQNTRNSPKFSALSEPRIKNLKNLQFIKMKDIVVQFVNYKGIRYPVCLYNNKPLPPFIAIKIAAICGKGDYENEATRNLALQLFNEGYSLLKEDIANGEMDAIIALFALGIQHYTKMQDFLIQALKTKQDALIYYFLNHQCILLSPEEFNFYVKHLAQKISSSEDSVRALVYAHQPLFKDKEKFPYAELAQLCGKYGYLNLLNELQAQENASFSTAADSAFKNERFDVVKWILANASKDVRQAIILNVFSHLTLSLQDNHFASNPMIPTLIRDLFAKYDGETYDSFTMGNITSLYEQLVHLHFPRDIQEQCLQKILSLANNNAVSVECRIMSPYVCLIKQQHHSNSPEEIIHYCDAAKNYLNTIYVIPFVPIAHALLENDFAKADQLLEQNQENPVIRKWLCSLSKYHDIYEKDANGDTCLQRAVKGNRYQLLKLLLLHCYNKPDCELDKVDNDGHSPLANAIRLKHPAIAKILIMHGATITDELITLCNNTQQNELAEMMQRFHLLEKINHEALSKNDLSATSLIISTEAPDAADNLDQSGDVDYAKNLASAIQQATNLSVQYCNADTKKILDHTLQKKGANTILHLMINAPRTGFAIDLEYLANLKQKGCQIVMSALEFAKHQNEAYKFKTLEYLQYAEQIIFLDEKDKAAAILFARKNHVQWLDKLKAASVLAVPPTIPKAYLSQEKENNNIMCFGMLRRGKGFAHIMHLAELIKASQAPNLKNKQIFIVGSVQKHKTRQDGTAYDPTLYHLLCKMYPDKADDFLNQSPQELKDQFLALQDQGVTPTLPIKLFLDVDQQALPNLFRQCAYAFYPAYRGATLRNSSLSTALAYGCIVYSHIGSATPDCLQNEGEYNQALVLFDDDAYQMYAGKVADDILLRENNSADCAKQIYSPKLSLNEMTKKIAKRLLDHELSETHIADQHLGIYQTLLKPEQLNKPTQLVLNLLKYGLLSKTSNYLNNDCGIMPNLAFVGRGNKLKG